MGFPTPKLAGDSAPYPAGATLATGEPIEPLQHRTPGYIFEIGIEDLFDAIYRDVGQNSFDEALRKHKGCIVVNEASEPMPWTPAPEEGTACECLAGVVESSEIPSRSIVLKRKPHFLGYLRWAVHLPDFSQDDAATRIKRMKELVICNETWQLHGLGAGEGFLITNETKVEGLPVSDQFVVHLRYKATTLSENKTQLDAEMELRWQECSPVWWNSGMEMAVKTEFNRNFEASYLPLVVKTLITRRSEFERADREQKRLCFVDENDVGDAAEVASQASAGTTVAGDAEDPDAEGEEKDTVPDLPKPKRHALKGEYDLRVEVVSAYDLSDPSFRLGDIGSNLVSVFTGRATLLGYIFVDCVVGHKKVRTDTTLVNGDENSVMFDRERALFAFNNEEYMSVTCCDRRGPMTIGGNPMIGTGKLELGPRLADCLPRWTDVPMERSGHPTGFVSIRYQLLQLSANGGYALSLQRRESLLRAQRLNQEAKFGTISGTFGRGGINRRGSVGTIGTLRTVGTCDDTKWVRRDTE